MKLSRLILQIVISATAISNLSAADVIAAASDAPDTTLVFNTTWKGERIQLPPPFAPAMKLKGTEEIRFAPGMFDAGSATFFSYAFVFSVSKDQALTEDIIQREILAYYRGLSESILKRKNVNADADKFTFKLQQAKEAAGTPEKVAASAKAVQYHGELNWTEPFVTAKPQVLYFEIQSWADPATSRNYLFVCTSPKPRGDADATWTELRAIRRSFEVKGTSGK
ncbi:MAG: hypothetical protein WCK55_07645 [Verrucomicrobiota bacterium]